MPAITISAVNTGTDTITAVAHGLLTGDRCRLRNVGGALPAATPALVGATDYFAIKVDVDNIKISDTNAHALAGTNIVDLTGSGSGTNTVEYGLPYCNPTALPVPASIGGPAAQVKSVEVAAAWNALVAIYDLLTGQAQSIYHNMPMTRRLTPRDWVVFAGSATATLVQDPGGNLTAVWKLNTTVTGFDTFVTSIDYRPGDVLSALSVDIFGDAGTTAGSLYDVTVFYYATQSAVFGSAVQVAHITGIANTAAWSTQALTIDAPAQVLAAGGALSLSVKVRGDTIHSPNFCYLANITQTTATP